MVTTPAPGFVAKKAVARLAMVGLNDAQSSILRECFRTFGIAAFDIDGDPLSRLQKEKFEACVIPLDDAAESLLKAVRGSRSNQRIVVFGIGGDAQQVIRLSRYCINATFPPSFDRQSALKVVRATHLLVLNELRRYVRIPLVVDVRVDAGSVQANGSMLEISAGGLSLNSDRNIPMGGTVSLRFNLPTDNLTVKVRASVCWVRDGEKVFGFRFDATDQNRLVVKEWIDRYLDL